jgi:hypothetical protein
MASGSAPRGSSSFFWAPWPPIFAIYKHSFRSVPETKYLSVSIHSFTIYRRSRSTRPSKIAGIAFSIRVVRVPDCFVPAK